MSEDATAINREKASHLLLQTRRAIAGYTVAIVKDGRVAPLFRGDPGRAGGAVRRAENRVQSKVPHLQRLVEVWGVDVNIPAPERGALAGRWTPLTRVCERLQALLEDEDEYSDLFVSAAPVLALREMHPWVLDGGRTERKILAHDYLDALLRASVRVEEETLKKVGRASNTGRSLVQQLWTKDPPTVGTSDVRLRAATSHDVGSKQWEAAQEARKCLGEACWAYVRNPSAHDFRQIDLFDCMERLAMLSQYAQEVDEAGVEKADA